MTKTLAIEKKELFGEYIPKGFVSLAEGKAFLEKFIKDGTWLERKHMDKSKFHKHAIPYAVIIEKNSEKIFVYQRPKKDGESLPGKWSVGVGGHVKEKDKGNNPIKNCLEREIKEETGVENTEIRFVGCVNTETGRGAYHFGFLFLVYVDKINFEKCDFENCKLKSIDELNKMTADFDFEDWSKIFILTLYSLNLQFKKKEKMKNETKMKLIMNLLKPITDKINDENIEVGEKIISLLKSIIETDSSEIKNEVKKILVSLEEIKKEIQGLKDTKPAEPLKQEKEVKSKNEKSQPSQIRKILRKALKKSPKGLTIHALRDAVRKNEIYKKYLDGKGEEKKSKFVSDIRNAINGDADNIRYKTKSKLYFLVTK